MSELQQGLLIAAIGMGLVFAIIIFLWGLMALMMRVTSRERPDAEGESRFGQPETEKSADASSKEHHLYAVATAVAVCLALEKTKPRQAFRQQGGVSDTLSPWLTVHRSRQIEKKRTRG